MKEPDLRLRVILFLSLIIVLVFTGRIIYLSTVNPDFYKVLEQGQFTLKRGDIMDRNARILATSDEMESLYANPHEIKSKDAAANKLSAILNMPEVEIKNKLNDKKSFVWIKRQITPRENDLINKEKITGIGLRKEFKRFYPNKNLASQVLGFCDVDSQGIEGIEKSMDSYLVSDVKKNDFQINANVDDGLNVVLTLDSNIQAFAEKSLKDEVINTDSEFGSFILLDGYTGELLSLANYPDFDPNNYQKYDSKTFRNNAIFNQFEPGSVMKVFSLLSLVDNQSIDENDYFYCPGYYEKNGVTVKCTGVHHSINYYGIIKYSCNAGMLEAAEHIKDIDLLHYLKQFGFGSRTSVLLPGEQPGILRDIDKWSSRSMLAIPMGQEISVNALQIARAATTLVNDGVMVEPYIVKNIVNNDNKTIKSFKRTAVRRVLKSDQAGKYLMQ